MTWKSNFILLHRIFPVFLLKSPLLFYNSSPSPVDMSRLKFIAQLLTQIMMSYNIPTQSFWIMVTLAFADLWGKVIGCLVTWDVRTSLFHRRKGRTIGTFLKDLRRWANHMSRKLWKYHTRLRVPNQGQIVKQDWK